MIFKLSIRSHWQMSEAFVTAVVLSLSGGLQDAYTYLSRGKVFANAQTGNIILLSENLIAHNWIAVLHYLIPLLFFAVGIVVAEEVRLRYQSRLRFHW